MKRLLIIVLTSILLAGCSNRNPNAELELSFEAGIGIFSGIADYGEVTDSKIGTFKLTNNGDAALTGPPTLDNADFKIIYQSGCTYISPKKFCTIKVAFDAKGKVSGQIYNANLALDTAYIALTAKVKSVETISVKYFSGANEITTQIFGTIKDTTSGMKTITIKNISKVSINDTIVLSPEYSLLYDSCSGKATAAGNSCTIKVILNGAGKSGVINGSVVFGGATLLLTGEVTPKAAAELVFVYNNVESTSLDLGSISGTQTKQVILYVKNIGAVNSAVLSLTLNNSNTSIVYDMCNGKTLSPTKTCQMRLYISAANKIPNTYTSQLTNGSESLAISYIIPSGPDLIEYVPTYSTYGSCSAIACSISGLESRTIVSCQKKVNGINAAGGIVSDCASFATSSNLDRICSSPSGNKIIEILNGDKTVSCPAGSSSQTFVSLTCDLNFHPEGELCVADTISYNPIYSDYGTCSALTCEGQGIESRIISDCKLMRNGNEESSVDLGNCSEFSVSLNLERSCDSPAGQVNDSISHGSKTMSCLVGSTLKTFVSINCDSTYHSEDNNTCISNNQVGSCSALSVANATFNPGKEFYSKIWNGSSYNSVPSNTHTSNLTTECGFQCNGGYTYDGVQCNQAIVYNAMFDLNAGTEDVICTPNNLFCYKKNNIIDYPSGTGTGSPVNYSATIQRYQRDIVFGALYESGKNATVFGVQGMTTSSDGKNLYTVHYFPANGSTTVGTPLYPAGTNGIVNVWTINQTTGILSLNNTMTVGSQPRGIDISPDDKNVYVANTYSTTRYISQFSRNLTSGSLSFLSPATISVSSIATGDGNIKVSPDGLLVYLLTATSTTYNEYNRSQSTGLLSLKQAVIASCSMGNHIENAACTPNSKISSCPVITVPNASFNAGQGSYSSVWNGSYYNQISNNKFTNDEDLTCSYKCDSGYYSEDNGLSCIAGTPANPATTLFASNTDYGMSSNIAVLTPNGKFSFKANNIINYPSGTGTGAPVNYSATIKMHLVEDGISYDAGEIASVYGIFDMVISPDGKNLYTTHIFPANKSTTVGTAAYPTGTNGIVSSYSINLTTGALTFMGSYPTGSQPRGITINPNGKFIYAVNAHSKTITLYSRDTTSGSISIHPLVTSVDQSALSNITENGKIAISADGKILYLMTHPTVKEYGILESSGILNIFRSFTP